MKAIFNTLTDEQRVNTLNNLYQKGISTPKESLNFSADKLVYIKPFIAQLLSNSSVKDLSSRLMIRQVVDELLADIIDEVAASCSRNAQVSLENVARELGLSQLLNAESPATFNIKRVA